NGSLGGNTAPARFVVPAVVFFLSLVLASCANFWLASWLGVPRPPGQFSGVLGVYRRLGPGTCPQGLFAGSSLLVSALSWSEISGGLGQGMETWGIGGSSPDVWEVWQEQRPFSRMTIFGISVYDLNEMHLADVRAMVVPLSRTIKDLRAS